MDFFPEFDKAYAGVNSINFATQCKLLGYEIHLLSEQLGKTNLENL